MSSMLDSRPSHFGVGLALDLWLHASPDAGLVRIAMRVS
jgi:hypothetical protein